jgi:signal transduction histidine kinase
MAGIDVSRPVLLVEDDDDHAALFRELFVRTGLAGEVWRAKSLAEGCQMAAVTEPGVIVLDLGLPDSSGRETIQAIETALRQYPVIVLTANTEEALSFDAVRGGAQDYLVKGHFTPDLLKRSVRYATERKRALLELERKNEEVEAFASLASHDLQSPLRRIHEAAEALSEELGEATGDAAFFLGTLKDSTARLQLLVSDILRFSRIGKEALNPVPVPLESVVEGALSLLSGTTTSASSAVRVADLPEVVGDERLLQTLLGNLISNAVKYVRNTEPVVWITAEERERTHIVHVRDNGIGIPAEQCERVFEPLVRFVSSEEFEGNGLGLSACRRIVEAHGGRIWVVSEPGKGSTFSFTLPK